ncbi:hypothetical protein BGW38_006673, partial [Lunasporangiospora selenospora]
IGSIHQGKMSVAAYSNEFRRYMRLIPKLDEDSALFSYMQGLDLVTSTQVRLKQSTNLDEAVFQATVMHSMRHRPLAYSGSTQI